MEVIKVGIFLEDKVFSEALSIGLARETRRMRFYQINSLSEGDFCDLILTSGSSDSSRVVQMVREYEEGHFEGPPYKVYRYQESQNLINDLLFIYFKVTGKVVESRGEATLRLLVFAADSGGCGTTSTAIAAAKSLYRTYGSKSLYLNLCPLDDSRKYLEEGGEDSLLKLLYYLDQEKDFPIESFITGTEEIDYVNTGVVNTYFNEMRPLLMSRFLQKIDKLGIYHFLIVDMGNHLSRENKKLLARADTAVIISDGERNLPGKYSERITREICARIENGKVIRVKNFAPEFPEDETENMLTVTKRTEADTGLRRNYGMEISRIAREIMEDRNHESAG